MALEGLSLAEQIRLFAGAGTVVAPHGAGLANLAYMPAGGRVVEFLPANCATAPGSSDGLLRPSVTTGWWCRPTRCHRDGRDPDIRVDLAALAAALELGAPAP